MSAGPATVSATGGSADTQAVDVSPNQWQPKRRTACAIVTAAFVAPLVSSVASARAVGAALPHPSGVLGVLGWWTAVVVASTATMLAVDREARRLLPLAALFRLALVFPDRAPSRYRIALRTGTVHQLSDRLRDGADLGGTPAEAAENLIRLVTALGRHDRLSRGHSERVRAYADLLGAELGLSTADRQRLHWAALVHDVGKMHVRAELLNKPGRPTDEEWQELRSHPAHAERMLAPLRPWLGDWLDAATQHHERIDGRGYPAGLRGDEITLAGRIVAVADAYDCMTSARSYKRPLPAAQARFELTRNSGTQFDAEVVRAMLRVSVGRMHLAAGPLSWLAQLPVFRQAISVATSAPPVMSGVAGGAAAMTAAALGALTVPAAFGAPAEAAESPPAAMVEAVQLAAGDGRDSEPAPQGTEPPPATTTETTPTTDGLAASTTSTTHPGTTTSTTVPDSTTTTTPTTGPTTPTTAATPDSTTSTTVPATTSTTIPATTTTAPNSPPVAADDSASVVVLSSTMIPVLANDSDPDGSLDPASLQITAGPAVGTAVVSGGKIRYTAPLLPGSATVGYRICDNRGACTQAVLTIEITLL